MLETNFSAASVRGGLCHLNPPPGAGRHRGAEFPPPTGGHSPAAIVLRPSCPPPTLPLPLPPTCLSSAPCTIHLSGFLSRQKRFSARTLIRDHRPHPELSRDCERSSARYCRRRSERADSRARVKESGAPFSLRRSPAGPAGSGMIRRLYHLLAAG